MSPITTFKERVGRPMPVLGSGSSSTGSIQFKFGIECQRVDTCVATKDVVGSDEFCLVGGDLYSASYQALPYRDSNKKVIYSSTIRYKPTIHGNSSTVSSCGVRSNSCGLIKW